MQIHRTMQSWLDRQTWWDTSEFSSERRSEFLAFLVITLLVAVPAVLMLFRGTHVVVRKVMTSEAMDDLRNESREASLGGVRLLLDVRPSEHTRAGAFDGRIVEFDAVGVLNGKGIELVENKDHLLRYGHRVQQVIAETARGATETELMDPELAAIRERIKAGVNRIVKRKMVDDVMMTHYRCFSYCPGPLKN